MTVTLPAIAGARTSGANTAAWLKSISVRQVRIACGLVMFSYIFSHFFNHALGNISYATMEWWLGYHIWWWRIPIVNISLYAAAATHFDCVCGHSINVGTFALLPLRSRSWCLD